MRLLWCTLRKNGTKLKLVMPSSIYLKYVYLNLFSKGKLHSYYHVIYTHQWYKRYILEGPPK